MAEGVVVENEKGVPRESGGVREGEEVTRDSNAETNTNVQNNENDNRASNDASDGGREEEELKEEDEEEEGASPCLLSNPAFVKEAINQELLAVLLEMSFPEVRAEKALYYTNSAGIEEATSWLVEHSEDPTVDTPVKAPKLSKEEAERKALELQKLIRENRKKREKEDEIEKERKRLELSRHMLDTQRLLEEAEKKRYIEQIGREKMEHQREKERQKALLKEEWEKRFGTTYPEEEEPQVNVKSQKDQVVYWIGKLKKKASPSSTSPSSTSPSSTSPSLSSPPPSRESLLLSLSTLRTYCSNAQQNPMEKKYLSLRKENKVFKSRIAPLPEAVELLKALGFQEAEDGESLSITGLPDGYLLGQAVKYIDLVMLQLNG